jgi:hypothetical protein
MGPHETEGRDLSIGKIILFGASLLMMGTPFEPDQDDHSPAEERRL